MSTAMLITVYLIAALICGLIGAIAAPARGRHSGYWMIVGFLFPPAIILLFILRPGKGSYAHSRDPFRDADDRDTMF